MNKITEELICENSNINDKNSPVADNKGENTTENVMDYLVEMLEKRKLTRADVIFSSNLSKSYVYQVFEGKKQPKRNKAIAICFGLKLRLEETQHLLRLFGLDELSEQNSRDRYIISALNSGHSVIQCNIDLYENNMTIIE